MFRDTTVFFGGFPGTSVGAFSRHFDFSSPVSPVLRVIVSIPLVTLSRQIHIAHGVWGLVIVSVLLLTGLDDLLRLVIASGVSSRTRGTQSTIVTSDETVVAVFDV